MWNFDRYLDNVAIVEEDGATLTYGELWTLCMGLIGACSGRCLVFCMCSNEKGSLLGYVAFLGGGAVPLMLEEGLDPGLLGKLIESYKPDFLWVPERLAGSFGYERVFDAWGYVLLCANGERRVVLHPDLALLLTTSGSTGSPKFVRQSYLNIKSNTESIISYLHLDKAERSITTMPMSYTYGLSIINTHLWVGASIIMTKKTLMEKDFWCQLQELGATSISGVPYIYEMLDRLRFYSMELPSLRTMTQAGGKLSPELHRKLAKYAMESGRRFYVMYGQTEATARMSYLPFDKSLEKCGSVGVAIPGGEFCLLGDDGSEIKMSDTVGELVYHGANVTMGYAECFEDLAKGDQLCGVLATGDMAWRDADGFYYIVGRKSRFLKLFGSRVNLDETERLIRSAFHDLDCAACGTDDKMTVFVTVNARVSEVSRFLAEKTSLNPAAFEVLFAPKIPRGESGKVLYGQLNCYDNF